MILEDEDEICSSSLTRLWNLVSCPLPDQTLRHTVLVQLHCIQALHPLADHLDWDFRARYDGKKLPQTRGQRRRVCWFSWSLLRSWKPSCQIARSQKFPCTVASLDFKGNGEDWHGEGWHGEGWHWHPICRQGCQRWPETLPLKADCFSLC